MSKVFYLTLLVLVASAQITYDAEFWDGFENQKPYEHNWKEVQDLINSTTVQWYFDMTHHFLTGVERGVYNNDTLTLHEDCFGKKYVTRINWMAAML